MVSEEKQCFSMKPEDYSACPVPHGRGSYSYVISKFSQLSDLAKENR